MAEGRSQYLHDWYVSRKDIYKERHLLKNYGLTLQDFLDLLQDQDYRCKVCSQDLQILPPKRVHIDHNHDTGKIRGILCNTCNKGLGLFRDSPHLIRLAASYLEEN